LVGDRAGEAAGFALDPGRATVVDGRFMPGTVRLSSTVIKVETGFPLAVSPDGERFAMERQVGSGMIIRAADEPATAPAGHADSFLRIPHEHRAIFSPDGRRLAYIRALERSRWMVVVDGQEGKEYPWVLCLTFSPDSRRLAHVATLPDHRGMTVVVDGQEGRSYHGIHGVIIHPAPSERGHSPIRFSPDSRRVAFGASQSAEQTVLVVDGQEHPTGRDLVEDITWSPDSRSVAHTGRRLDRSGGGTVYLDGREVRRHAWVLSGSLRFSPDGQRLIYLAADSIKGPVFVVDDGKPGKPYNYVHPESLRFNPLGQLEFAAGVGDEPSGPSVGTPFGGTIMVGRDLYVIDGREMDGRRTGVVHSADGRRSAWISPVAGPHGVRAICAFIDGVQEKEVYQQIQFLQFSPDGRHCAFLVPGADRCLLVIDGIEHATPFSGPFTHLRFVTPDTLRGATQGVGELSITHIFGTCWPDRASDPVAERP
jgi:dipeptidyl aminopeptidase/acylaminoacyl peptidase